MSRLEIGIAWRFLRSRRGSRLLSLISVIAIGGVVIGVSALIVIMGVMTGLQNDLREKILIGSPDVRVLNYGSDMVLKDWQPVLDKRIGQHITGLMRNDGSIEWSFGRKRGLGL